MALAEILRTTSMTCMLSATTMAPCKGGTIQVSVLLCCLWWSLSQRNWLYFCMGSEMESQMGAVSQVTEGEVNGATPNDVLF